LPAGTPISSGPLQSNPNVPPFVLPFGKSAPTPKILDSLLSLQPSKKEYEGIQASKRTSKRRRRLESEFLFPFLFFGGDKSRYLNSSVYFLFYFIFIFRHFNFFFLALYVLGKEKVCVA
jgi:hypothetical protein